MHTIFEGCCCMEERSWLDGELASGRGETRARARRGSRSRWLGANTRIKMLYLAHELTDWTDHSGRRGKRLEQLLAVALRDQARVHDDHDPTIRRRANQAAEALLQPQRCVRHHVLVECIAARSDDRFAPGGGDR